MKIAKNQHFIKALFALVITAALISLAACGIKGKSVTLLAGGESINISYRESTGAFAAAAGFAALSDGENASVSAAEGDKITVTLEFAPDACSVSAFPSDADGAALNIGEMLEIDKSVDDYIVTFSVPDLGTAKRCGYNVEYIIDDVIYNLYFILDVG